MILIFIFFTVKRIGCFKDTTRRAIPGVDGRPPLLTGFYRRRHEAIKKCALYALMYGFKFFAVQHQGWCATGPRAHVTYRKYGPSNRCRNGKGGPWANDVYRISGQCFICRPSANTTTQRLGRRVPFVMWPNFPGPEFQLKRSSVM